MKQALPKLRVKADWFSDPARVRREAEGLRWLPRFAPPGTITPLVFEDPENFLLAMEAVPQTARELEDDAAGGAGGGRSRPAVRPPARRDPPAVGRRARRRCRRVRRPVVLRVAPGRAVLRLHGRAGARSRRVSERPDRRNARESGGAGPRRLQPEERPGPRRAAHPARPRGHPLGRPRVRRRLRADAPAEQGASPGHEHRAAFARAAGLFWETYADDARHQTSWQADLEPRAVRHALGCLLARVAGRSPLEYLDEPQRAAPARRRCRPDAAWRDSGDRARTSSTDFVERL